MKTEKGIFPFTLTEISEALGIKYNLPTSSPNLSLTHRMKALPSLAWQLSFKWNGTDLVKIFKLQSEKHGAWLSSDAPSSLSWAVSSDCCYCGETGKLWEASPEAGLWTMGTDKLISPGGGSLIWKEKKEWWEGGWYEIKNVSDLEPGMEVPPPAIIAVLERRV